MKARKVHRIEFKFTPRCTKQFPNASSLCYGLDSRAGVPALWAYFYAYGHENM